MPESGAVTETLLDSFSSYLTITEPACADALTTTAKTFEIVMDDESVVPSGLTVDGSTGQLQYAVESFKGILSFSL